MRFNHLVCIAIVATFAVNTTNGFGQSTDSSNEELRYYYLEETGIEQPSTIAKVAKNIKPKGDLGLIQVPGEFGKDYGYGSSKGCDCGSSKGSGCGCGGGYGCDSGTCGGSCRKCDFKVGLLYLSRDNPNNVPILQNAGGPIFSANQFDFDYETGFEFEVNRYVDSCTNWNLRYFQVDGFEDVGFASFGGGTSIATNPQIPIAGPGTAALQYRSELHSFEVNREKRVSDCTSFSFGIRLIELDDTLRLAANGAGGALAAEVNADNHLYGFQVGLNRILRSGGTLELSGYSKLGLYTDFADQSARVAGTTNFITGTSDGAATFVGEFGLVSNFKLNSRLSFVSDLRILYIDGVALAADQLPHIMNNVGGPSVARLDMSELFYYGGFLGLQFNL